MKSPSEKQILENISKWKKQNQSSWDRGYKSISFVEQGKQWGDNDINRRNSENKETLKINLTKKHLRNVQARGKTIELTLDVAPNSNGVDSNDVEHAKKIYKSLALCGKNRKIFSRSLDKTYAFGQSCMFWFIEREDSETLNKVPVPRIIEDPKTCFFDVNAPSRTLHDGMYCGIERKVRVKDLISSYPKIKTNGNGDSVVVIDYWYKKKIAKNYILLNSGVYKREDLIEKGDKHPSKRSKSYKSKSGCHYEVWHKRIAVGIDAPLENDSRYPTDDLPGVYNYGLTVWTENGYESYPYCHSMIDPQRFHNYLASQIATQAKNSTSDKYFGTKDMIKTQGAQESARNINQAEGFIAWDESPNGYPQRVSPQPVAPGMTEIMEVVKQDIEDTAGIFTENTSMVKQLSGVAFNSMMDVSNMMQNNVIKAHVETVEVMGEILGQMIPRIYTENRVLRTDDNDLIEINKKIDITNDIVNDVSKMSKDFGFTIKASVSAQAQKQMVAEELRQIYNVFPDAIPKTIDLYAKMLNTTYSGELSKRMSLLVDPNVELFASDKITRQQFDELESQQQQQDQQAQLEQSNAAASSSPQMQIEMQKVQEERFKAQAAQFRAETERMQMLLQNEIDKAGLNLDAHKLMSSNELEMEKANVSREQMENERFKSIMSHTNAELVK